MKLLSVLTLICFVTWVQAYCPSLKVRNYGNILSNHRPENRIATVVKKDRLSDRRFRIQLSTATQTLTVLTQQLTNLHKNHWYVLSLISLASTAGIYAEKTKIGEMLSGPLITMVFGLIACNTGLLPTTSVIYDAVLKYFVPLAIAFLLYDADLKKCFKVTGKLMTIFLIGSLGTILGTFGAYWLVPMKMMNGGKKIAAALCARHVRI